MDVDITTDAETDLDAIGLKKAIENALQKVVDAENLGGSPAVSPNDEGVSISTPSLGKCLIGSILLCLRLSSLCMCAL